MRPFATLTAATATDPRRAPSRNLGRPVGWRMADFPKASFDTAATCPLDGVRVLDLTRVVAGNMLTLMLADFGADVLKVETPGRGDPLREWVHGGAHVYWKTLARNKKSMTLNLRDEEGRRLFEGVLATAQVLVENYRPGVLEKMELAPERLLGINPQLVIVRISGFGQTGPYRDRPGFGTLIEAMSGLAAKTGFADREPVLPNLALADMIAGMNGAFATLVALREAEKAGGRGQVVDLSLLEPLMATLGFDSAIHQLSGAVPQRLGSRSEIAAPRNVYRTKDDRYVALSASTQAMTERLFRTIDCAALIDDPRFADNAARVANNAALDAHVASYIASRSRDEVLEAFAAAGVACAPVYDAGEVLEDHHIRERGVLVEVPDPEIGEMITHNIVPRLSATPGALRRPAPALGEHTREVLGGLGHDADALDALAQRGVI